MDGSHLCRGNILKARSSLSQATSCNLVLAFHWHTDAWDLLVPGAGLVLEHYPDPPLQFGFPFAEQPYGVAMLQY